MKIFKILLLTITCLLIGETIWADGSNLPDQPTVYLDTGGPYCSNCAFEIVGHSPTESATLTVTLPDGTTKTKTGTGDLKITISRAENKTLVDRAYDATIVLGSDSSISDDKSYKGLKQPADDPNVPFSEDLKDILSEYMTAPIPTSSVVGKVVDWLGDQEFKFSGIHKKYRVCCKGVNPTESNEQYRDTQFSVNILSPKFTPGPKKALELISTGVLDKAKEAFEYLEDIADDEESPGHVVAVAAMKALIAAGVGDAIKFADKALEIINTKIGASLFEIQANLKGTMSAHSWKNDCASIDNFGDPVFGSGTDQRITASITTKAGPNISFNVLGLSFAASLQIGYEAAATLIAGYGTYSTVHPGPCTRQIDSSTDFTHAGLFQLKFWTYDSGSIDYPLTGGSVTNYDKLVPDICETKRSFCKDQ